MAVPVLPLAVLIGGGFLLAKQEGGAPKPLDPAAQADLFEMRTLPDGTVCRFYRAERVPLLLTMLQKFGLEAVTTSKLAPTDGAMFRLVPLTGDPNASASQAVTTAHGAGLVVIASMNLPFDNGGDRFIVITPVAKRSLANATSQLAILEDVDGAVITPAPSPGPNPTTDPLSTLPPEIKNEVQVILSDPNADPDVLEKEAATLEAGGFTDVAKLLRARAQTIRMQRQLKDQQAGGVPYTLRGANSIVDAADLPSALAAFYTGDGSANEWKKIVALNPGMTVTTGQFGTVPTPWHVGQVVLLPLSWNVREKGIPATKGTGSGKANAVPHSPGTTQDAVPEN